MTHDRQCVVVTQVTNHRRHDSSTCTRRASVRSSRTALAAATPENILVSIPVKVTVAVAKSVTPGAGWFSSNLRKHAA